MGHYVILHYTSRSSTVSFVSWDNKTKMATNNATIRFQGPVSSFIHYGPGVCGYYTITSFCTTMPLYTTIQYCMSLYLQCPGHRCRIPPRVPTGSGYFASHILDPLPPYTLKIPTALCNRCTQPHTTLHRQSRLSAPCGSFWLLPWVVGILRIYKQPVVTASRGWLLWT